MDQFIYLLIFVIFSAVSAYLDRRRRRQSLEEARRRHEAAPKQAAAAARAEVEEEEEEQGKWPWPEIFEQSPARPKQVELERVPAEVVSTEVSAPEAPGEGKYRRAEEELREMDQRVRQMEERARQAERRSLEEFQFMEEQAAARMGSVGQGREPVRHRKQGWSLTPREARRALVYAEILGRPKSERPD
ncbi:MAG: hypothetical protein FJY95_14450 [Candidatus Handelsmanbacteria bacterium]|nr:hypothetical protein [Candidatus Handelsmanbacteria bacterium]